MQCRLAGVTRLQITCSLPCQQLQGSASLPFWLPVLDHAVAFLTLPNVGLQDINQHVTYSWNSLTALIVYLCVHLPI